MLRLLNVGMVSEEVIVSMIEKEQGVHDDGDFIA